jgi:acetyl esterase/lipase
MAGMSVATAGDNRACSALPACTTMRIHFSAFALPLLGLLASCGGGGGSSAQRIGQYFESAVFEAAQVKSYSNVVFSHRPNTGGVQFTSDARKSSELGTDQLTLLMDVWVPPNATSATPMPLVVFVHGGGFKEGGKEDRSADAVSYASTGFVTASVNYRLTPNNTDTAELRQTAIINGADDVMNAIRFLKKNAATYHIDTSRVAIVGTSAGGALALIDAVQADTLAGTTVDAAYTGVSATVQAVVSTGATLIDEQFDSDDLLTYDSTDAPVLMFHASPTDGTTGATWAGNVVPTCNAINGSGDSCTAIQAPTGCQALGQASCHTVPIGLTSKWWATIQPFLWNQLLLASM